jgi:hypothetical protein
MHLGRSRLLLVEESHGRVKVSIEEKVDRFSVLE